LRAAQALHLCNRYEHALRGPPPDAFQPVEIRCIDGPEIISERRMNSTSA
jgi:hypothetical protein